MNVSSPSIGVQRTCTLRKKTMPDGPQYSSELGKMPVSENGLSVCRAPNAPTSPQACRSRMVVCPASAPTPNMSISNRVFRSPSDVGVEDLKPRRLCRTPANVLSFSPNCFSTDGSFVTRMVSNQAGSICLKSWPMSSIAKPKISNVGFEAGCGAGLCARASPPPRTTTAVNSQAIPAVRITLLCAMCLLPGPDSAPALIKDPFVVPLAHLEARLRREQAENRRPHVEHGEVRARTLGSDRVGAEQEAVRVLVEHRGDTLDRRRRRDGVLGDLVPRDVERDVAERGIAHHGFHD